MTGSKAQIGAICVSGGTADRDKEAPRLALTR
jgi:hypothetical protein